MRNRTLAQDKPSSYGHSGALAKIMPNVTDRFVINTFGAQQGIQIELDRVKRQEPLGNVVGFGRASAQLHGGASVLRRHV
ncbi:hypothetical protein [Sinorhizobium sp. KGO-5]|uniref:hypothetical protein n=1 Tax=Sinorhizobium sp. KGO-5 TaxID=1470810 RepID=UPI0030C6F740